MRAKAEYGLAVSTAASRKREIGTLAEVPLPKQSGSKGMMPSTWTGRGVRVAVLDDTVEREEAPPGEARQQRVEQTSRARAHELGGHGVGRFSFVSRCAWSNVSGWLVRRRPLAQPL